jgi:hypothetical protein
LSSSKIAFSAAEYLNVPVAQMYQADAPLEEARERVVRHVSGWRKPRCKKCQV